MKNLFTLLGTFLALATFAQQQNHQKYHADPNSARPPLKHFALNSNSRSVAQACDTGDVLDYNTYNENFAALNGLTFNGTWNGTPAPIATELTSFVDTISANLQMFRYAEVNFDSICFANLTDNSTLFYPRSASTIYLDSMGMFLGVFGDTSLTGAMLHDSIIFTVYPVNGSSISATPAQVIVYGGRSQLGDFLVGPNYLHYVQIPIHQQFTQGQGFAVRMDYLNKDTSSHCILSYTYADSCGTYTQGGVLYAYPAYPAPVHGTSLSGAIIPQGTGATVLDITSDFVYQNTGYAAHCDYVYWQNWYFLPIVDICVDYGVTVVPATTASCPNSTVSLTSALYGTTNAANATYTWSASSGSLSSTSIPNPDLTMPATGNVTVTLSVNDGTNTTTNSVVIQNNGIGIAISNGTTTISCGGSLNLTTTTSGIQTGPLVYSWSTGATISHVTATQPGTYTVTVTNGKGCSASASANVTYSNGVNNTVSFTPPTTVCEGKPATFTNTSSATNNWTATWAMGDGTQVIQTNAVYTYTTTGLKYVVLTMDSGGCSFSTGATAHGVTVLASTNALCTNIGIEEVTFSNSISLFPNPTNGNVSISVTGIEKNISIKVYNILGSEVKSFTSNDVPASFNKNFDFSEFASGAYLVKIQSGDKIAVKKLTISK